MQKSVCIVKNREEETEVVMTPYRRTGQKPSRFLIKFLHIPSTHSTKFYPLNLLPQCPRYNDYFTKWLQLWHWLVQKQLSKLIKNIFFFYHSFHMIYHHLRALTWLYLMTWKTMAYFDLYISLICIFYYAIPVVFACF